MTDRRDDLASWGRVVHPTPRFVKTMPWSGSAPVWTPDEAPLLAFGGGAPTVPCAPTEGTWNRIRAAARGLPADATLAGPAAQ